MKKTKALSVVFALLLSLQLFTLSMLAADEEGGEIKPTAALDHTQTDNYSPVIYDEDLNPEGLPYGKWKAGSNSVIYLSDVEWVSSENTAGRATAKNGKYKDETEAGITLAQTMKFDKGLGMHPNSASADIVSNTVIDVWQYVNPEGEYKCDSLYTVVGLTNLASPGVYFHIYGDKGDGNGFVKLACSELIVLGNIGEFNVDITGVHTLKFMVTVKESHSSSASAFADLCIFKADPTAVKPDYSVGGGDEDNTDENTETDKPVGELVTPATDTGKPSTGTEKPGSTETTAPSEEKTGGCGSSLSAGLVAIGAVALCGAATMVGKRRRK